MKVILTEKVSALGSVGEVVRVSAGYARNFLFPKKFAVLADEGNSKQLDHQKKALAKKMSEEKGAAEAVKGKLDGMCVEFVKKVGASGKLFGSVTTQEISNDLSGKGIEVEKRIISLEKPIKAVGTYSAKAKLFSDVEANFEVRVSMDPAQALEIKEKQAAAEKRAEEKKKRAESGETEEVKTEEEAAPLTEDEKLTLEANKILRG